LLCANALKLRVSPAANRSLVFKGLSLYGRYLPSCSSFRLESAGRDYDLLIIRSSIPDVDSGKGMKQSENIQQPENHGDYHDAVQDRLDGRLHRNEAVHQPQQNTYHDQNFQDLN